VTESGEQVLPSSSERKGEVYCWGVVRRKVLAWQFLFKLTEFWKTCLNVALMALLLSDGRELNLYQQIPNSSK